jgi:hypothetical protein
MFPALDLIILPNSSLFKITLSLFGPEMGNLKKKSKVGTAK